MRRNVVDLSKQIGQVFISISKKNESNFNFNSSKSLVRNNSDSLEHQVFVLA